MTDPTRVRRPRPVLRAIGAVVAFYVLGFLLVALFLIPFAKYLTRGASAEELAAHPTPLFALGQGLALLLGFGLATWVVGRRALGLSAGGSGSRPCAASRPGSPSASSPPRSR